MKDFEDNQRILTTKRDKVVAYEIINHKLNSEVSEFYSINNLFLLIQTLGIFGILSAMKKDEKSFLLLIPLFVLLITAIFWKDINFKAKIWRDYWLERAEDLEKSEVTGDIQLWQEISKDKTLYPARGVWKIVMRLPYVFIVVWVVFILINVCTIDVMDWFQTFLGEV